MDVKGPAHLEQRQQRFSVGYAIAVIIALVVIQSLFSGPHTENLSYSDFKRLVTNQKVTDLVLEDRTITGTLVSKGLEGMLPAEKIAELQRYGGGEHRFVSRAAVSVTRSSHPLGCLPKPAPTPPGACGDWFPAVPTR